MFSHRLPLSLTPNRIAVALDVARATGRPLLDLTESNPTQVGLSYPSAAIVSALSDPRLLRYEPTPQGLMEAREAIATAEAGRGRLLDPARLFLTASTSEAYSLLFKLLCNPGDAVLVPRPSYPLFDQLAALEGVTLRRYPLHYHQGWFLEPEHVAPLVDPKVRALLLVHPNNPTGSYLKRGELERLVPLLAQSDLALISDEVFVDYLLLDASESERVTTLASEARVLTFVLSGLSKRAGLPQLKLGWIHVSGPPKLVADALERLEHISDAYLGASTPVQLGAGRLLELGIGDQLAARVRRNHEGLRAALDRTALQLLRLEGGWSAVLRVPHTKSEEAWVLELLEEDGVLVHPGSFFDFESEAYLVLSLIVDPSVFDEGIARLVRRLG
jgi:alanine-synthesizing transaminase